MNKALKSLLVFCLIGAAFAQTYCPYDNTVNGGVQTPGLICSCYSGYYGAGSGFADCSLKADPQCAFNPAPDQLVTGYIPYLDESQSSVNNGEITLVIKSPLVTSRLDATIEMLNEDGTCTYPGALWTKTVTGCNDTFVIVVTIADAVGSCGWTYDNSDSTYTYLRNVLKITQRDMIGEQRGVPLTRTTQSIIRVEIRFPKRITVTSEISVFSAVNLLAAITLQGYDPITNTGVLEYTTSLQYPFKISDIINLITPFPITSNYSVTDLNCPETQNSICTQKIRLVLEPNTACNMTGQYNLTTLFACRGPSAACPLDANTNTGLIASNVVSEDFCQVVRFDIDLNGVLEVYQDAQHTTKKTAFLPSQTAYFKATVWSTKATIIDSSISSVFYTLPDSTSRSLFAAGAQTLLAQANQFAITPLNATAEGFQFVVSVGETPVDMFPVNTDSNAPFLFSANIEVQWQGLNDLATAKRFSFALAQSNGPPTGTQNKKFDTQMLITPLNSQTPTAAVPFSDPSSSASTVVLGMASMIVAIIALL